MSLSADRGQPDSSSRRPAGARPAVKPDHIGWLALAAAVFTAAQLLFVSPRMGLSWDEVVYVSQFSSHAPAAYFDPARARGVPLLVAPVVLVTSSVVALRVYLAILSGLGLFLALLPWRRQRPAWLLALAAVLFGGLWVAQYYGPQAMPDEWVAFGVLATAGLFLRAVARPGAVPPLAGLAGSLALTALVRPIDAVFLTAALAGAVLVVRAWRDWRPLMALAAGLAAGVAEWVIEAFARFGSPLGRLRQAGAEQSGFGLHLGAWDELRALNGPTLCRPCTVGLRYPALDLWWLALPVVVAFGVIAARRAGRLSSALLPAVAALAVATPYLLLINYAAPRFLLPAYALLSLPAADAVAGLVGGVRREMRQPVIALVAVVIAVQLVTQQLVLRHEVAGTIRFHRDYAAIAADLRRLGIRPPCVVKGDQHIPIAFYAGCASAGTAGSVLSGALGREPIAVLVFRHSRPPSFARDWHRYRLPGTRVLHMVAYLPPRTASHA